MGSRPERPADFPRRPQKPDALVWSRDPGVKLSPNRFRWLCKGKYAGPSSGQEAGCTVIRWLRESLCVRRRSISARSTHGDAAEQHATMRLQADSRARIAMFDLSDWDKGFATSAPANRRK